MTETPSGVHCRNPSAVATTSSACSGCHAAAGVSSMRSHPTAPPYPSTSAPTAPSFRSCSPPQSQIRTAGRSESQQATSGIRG